MIAAAVRGVVRAGAGAPTELAERRIDPDRGEDGAASVEPDRATRSDPLDAGGAAVDAPALAPGPGVDVLGPGVATPVAGAGTWLAGSGTVTGGSAGAAGTWGSPNESTSFCGSTVTAPAGAAVARAQIVINDAAAQARARRERLDTVVAAVCA